MWGLLRYESIDLINPKSTKQTKKNMGPPKKWYFYVVLILETGYIGWHMVNRDKHQIYNLDHEHDYNALT